MNMFEHLFLFFSDMIGFVLVDFLHGSTLVVTMQYVSMAVLTILIPLGVAVLDKEDEKVLERYIVLDHVIGSKRLALAIAGLMLSILFWEYLDDVFGKSAGDAIHLVLFFFWVFSIWTICRIIVRVYQWLKKKDIGQYVIYLKMLRSLEDMPVVWGEVWRRKEEDWRSEAKFFSIFSVGVETLLKEKKYRILNDILRTFEQFLFNRSLIFLIVAESVFSKILEWHYISWSLQYECLVSYDKTVKNSLDYGMYGDLSRTLDEIINKIENRVLLEGEAYGFFHNLKAHVDRYGKECKKNLDGKSYYYLESLNIQIPFFEDIEKSKEAYDIQKYHFPPDWKITPDIIKEEHLASRVWFNEFMRWIQGQINIQDKEYDDRLNKVIETLFPDIHMVYFPYILAFVSRSWVDDRRMTSIIDNPPKFGGYYHYSLMDAVGKTEDDLEEVRTQEWEDSKSYTIVLSIKLFRRYFLEVEKYIKELKLLEGQYKDDKKKEYLRRELLDIFQKIKDECESTN